MSTNNIYQKAIDKWGVSAQASMTMGECGELISALNQFFCQQKCSEEDVIDEIADVQIMINQMKLMFGEDKVDKRIEEKLKRLSGIIDGSIDHPHK